LRPGNIIFIGVKDMAKPRTNSITQDKAKELMTTGKEVCYKYKGKTFCTTIKSVRGSARATLNNGMLVPYHFLVPKESWKEDYVSPRTKKQQASPQNDANYDRSNKTEIEPLPKTKLPSLHSSVKDMGFCLDRMRDTRKECADLSSTLCKDSFEQDRKCTERNAQKLIQQLNNHYDIPNNLIKIDGKRKDLRRGGDVYGVYHVGSSQINVYPYTKVKEDVVSDKALLETIVHEWNHHYDTKKLKLNSIHTAGFYKRTGTLYSQLKDPLEKK
jgi:hypothetical protein